MRPLTRSGFGVAALVAIAAACSDNSSTAAVTAPAVPTSPNLALTTPVCDPSAVRSAARSFAASNKDPLFTIIGDLQSLYKNKTNGQTTDKAFDGLARLAAIRGTPDQASTATGEIFNSLTLGFIGCMQSSIASNLPDDFSVADALGAGWIYEVRGKTGADPETGAYERGSSGRYWALEAPAGWAASIAAGSPQKRFLVYGYPITFAVKDNTVGTAIELRTVPKIGNGLLLQSALNVGVCNVDIGTTARVQHIGDVLPKKELTCAAAAPFRLASGQRSFSPLALAERAVAWLSPKPAYAAMFVGSIGGAVSELSPSVVIDIANVKFKFQNGIADGRNSRPFTDSLGNPVSVSAKTAGGTALPAGILVTLSIAGNQSSIAFFKEGKNGASVVTVSRTTDANGIATFDNVYVTKAGGYQIVAKGTWDGVDGVPVTSNSFNIQNK